MTETMTIQKPRRTPEQVKAAVRAAVAKLDPNDDAHWDPATGHPSRDVLSGLCGFPVTIAKLGAAVGTVIRPGWTPPAAPVAALDVLRAQIADLNERTAAPVAALDVLRAQIADLNERTAELADRLDALEGRQATAVRPPAGASPAKEAAAAAPAKEAAAAAPAKEAGKVEGRTDPGNKG